MRDFIDSSWKPALALVLAAALALGVAQLGPAATDWALLGFALCTVLTAGVAVWQVVKHGLGRGALTGCAAVLVGSLGVLMLLALGVSRALFDESEDPFARDLKVPADLRMREPRDPAAEGLPSEPWSAQFQGACEQGAATPSAQVDLGLSQLEHFQGAAKDKLVAYLSRSRLWHVTEERGHRYAYRRFAVGSEPLRNSLNGYYSTAGCQFRVVLGLDGPALAAPWAGKATTTRPGAGSVQLTLTPSTNEGRLDSYLVVEGGGLAVEIYDERATRDRTVTRLALALVEEELARAERGEPPAAPPSDADGGSPAFELTRGFQGGLYLVTAEVNPGEPGTVYLQAFEVTRNTRLSEGRLGQRSRATVGWSKDPAERFHYEADITIYEGDWGVYYPARFELWFTPASGGPERKLVEDVFRIEGWQR